MAVLVEAGALVAALIILYVLYVLLKSGLHLLANTVMGFIIFLIVNLFLVRDVAINFFSLGVVALAGIPGVILVLLLHFLGWGF